MEIMRHISKMNKERIKEIIPELERRKKSKLDFIVGTNKMNIDFDEQFKLSFEANKKVFHVDGKIFLDWNEAEANAAGKQIEVRDAGAAIGFTTTGFSQLCDKGGIPLTYVRRLQKAGYNDLLLYNLQNLWGRRGKKQMIRTLDGKVRAVLSSSYKIMDNTDLFFKAADEFGNNKAEIWDMRLTDDRFYLYAVSPSVTASVRPDRPTGGGHAMLLDNSGDDPHFAAVSLSNSETGKGGLHVCPAILRGVCANLLIFNSSVSSIHLGRRKEEEGIVFGDDTKESEAQTIWLKVRDTLKTVFDPEKFEVYIAMLNDATQDVLGDSPAEVVTNISSHLAISEHLRERVLDTLIRERDNTRFGFIQALTSTANMTESVEDASMLEEAGGKLLNIPKKKFAQLIS